MSRSKNDDIQRFPYGIIDELYSVQKYSMVSRSLCVKLPCKTEHLLNRSCTNKSSHTWSRSIRLPRDNLIAKKTFCLTIDHILQRAFLRWSKFQLSSFQYYICYKSLCNFLPK